MSHKKNCGEIGDPICTREYLRVGWGIAMTVRGGGRPGMGSSYDLSKIAYEIFKINMNHRVFETLIYY